MRSVLLALFFFAFMGTAVALVATLIVPTVPGLLGVAPGESVGAWQGLATIGLAVPLAFGALYAGGLVWLFLACQWFTRDEIEEFMSAGPNTRLEIWVLRRFSR